MMNLPTKGSMDLSSKNWDFPSLRRWTKQHWGIWPHDVVLRKIEGCCIHAFFHGQTIGDTSQKDFITCILWKPCALWKNPLVHKQQTKTKWSFRRKKQNTKRVWNVNLKTLETWIATPKKIGHIRKKWQSFYMFRPPKQPQPLSHPFPGATGPTVVATRATSAAPGRLRPGPALNASGMWHVGRTPPGSLLEMASGWGSDLFIFIHTYITLHYKTLH